MLIDSRKDGLSAFGEVCDDSNVAAVVVAAAQPAAANVGSCSGLYPSLETAS